VHTWVLGRISPNDHPRLPLPAPGGVAVIRVGGSTEVDDPPARRVLTDQPYNVPIAGHVAGGQHREFAMASGDSAPSRAVPTRMC
jgi:hypothetical protein